MLVTTSRDPSMKARRFGKALASFLSLPYLNRGKRAPDGDETWLVVVEDHGNPRGLVKRSPGKEEHLAFRLSGEPEAGRQKKCVPVVTGAGPDAIPIAQFFELEWVEKSASEQARVLSVASGRIDFIDVGEAKFRLKI
jgi:hypothetical protein